MTESQRDNEAQQASIRARGQHDVAGCVRALRAVYESDGYPSVWPADPDRWVTSGGTDAAAWVAVDGQGLVRGHVAVRSGTDDSLLQAALPAVLPAGTDCRPARLLSVVRLFVDPAGRGQASGAALLRAAVGYARSRSLQPVLEVAESGAAAMRLYGRLGWTRVGTRQASWTDAAGRHPAVHLYALLPG